MKNQRELFPVANHSKLGKQWEAELETLHEYYLLQGWADVVKNAEKWVFAGNAEYDTLFRGDPGMVARDGNGRPMKRVKSDVDFSGGGRGKVSKNSVDEKRFAIVFDAKHTIGETLKISMLTEHQILRMARAARCGLISGFLVMMANYDRAFFITVAVARRKRDIYDRQTGERAAKGTASFSIEELEKTAIEIPRSKQNGFFDWLTVLT